MKRKIIFLISLLLLVNIVYGETLIEKITKKGSLVIGITPGFVPFEFKWGKKGELIGFDIELARLMSKEINVKPEFKEYEFNKIFKALETDEIDIIISGITITEKRKKNILFSNPYYSTEQVLVITAKHENAKSYTELDKKGIKIAAIEETTGNDIAKKIFKSSEILLLKDDETAVNKLLNDEIDGFVYDKPFAIILNQYQPKIKYIDNALEKEDYAIAIKKQNTENINWINDFIKKIKDSEKYEELIDYWFKDQDWKRY